MRTGLIEDLGEAAQILQQYAMCTCGRQKAIIEFDGPSTADTAP